MEKKNDKTLTCSVENRKTVRRALSDAYQSYIVRHNEPPTWEKLCFQALQDAMGTLHRSPDKEGAWLRGPRSCWPEMQEEPAAQQRVLKELLSAISSGKLLTNGKTPCTPRELSNMDAVLAVFPQAVVGRKQLRDWGILCRLAMRRGEGPKLAVELGVTKQDVYKVRDRQLKAIARRLRDLMPDEVCYHLQAA